MSEPHLGHDHRCQDFLERLSRYLDDELPAPDRQTIERHLRDCPCCEEVLDSLKHTVGAVPRRGPARAAPPTCAPARQGPGASNCCQARAGQARAAR